jgi:hypothetical protein
VNPLSAIKTIIIFILCLWWGVANAADNLYVFVFKNGAAQQNITVSVGDQQKDTNQYGLANFAIPADDYEVGYYKDGELFALTDIKLLDDQQSQIFLELTQDGAEVDLDLPLAAYNQKFEQKQIKEQTGPKGTLKLKLIDSKGDAPIAGAKLFFKGYAVEAVSDENGIATVELSEGNYDISVIHPKYVMRVLKDMNIKADATHEQDAKLVRADIVMQEYVVSAPAVEGSLASTLTALKESSVIGEALSSEEFTKAGDSSAADALKRVTGITIVDGKYVYVRGLGERYSVVMLNDLYVPSPEPTKRVVPLDIFPSSVIQSMHIQKTYSPDLPGTFAGGDVLIISKDIPEEDNYIKLSVSTTYNKSTGKEVYSNSDNSKGLPADIIEKSSNFQELQRGYPELGVPGYTEAELQALNSAIANYRSYNLQKTTLKPGYKVGQNAGQSFKTSGGLKYGFVGTIYKSTDADSKDATKYSTFYDIPTDELSAGERSDYQQTELRDKQGGLLSLGLDNQKGHRIKYTYLSVDDTENSTTFSQKDGGPKGPGIDDQKRTYYEYIERTINAHQLKGDHLLKFSSISSDLFNDIKINWALEKAKATRLEPGTVEYYYEKTSDVTDFTLNKKIWFLYSDLNDEVDNNRIDFTLPYIFNGNENYTSFGIFDYQKSRTLDNRRFKAEHKLGTDVFEDIDSVFTQENVDNGDLVLTSNYRPADAYTATQDVTAFYVKQLLSVRKDLDLLAGVRQESSNQQLIDTKSGEPYDPLETNDALTSLGVNYSINDENKIRLGFANTLSRPDFREFSPNRYKDPVTEDIVFGYPDLKYTTINNLDLKYEWYLSYDEIFSAGLFLKDFTNPVETIVNQDPDSQSGKKIISFRNAEGATSKGFEMSIRKKLRFFGNAFSNYFIASNFALIDSTIQLDTNTDDVMIKELSTTNRPMQGQSPYVINFNIGYDNLNTGRSAILLYNEFGKRIVALGSYGAPDYYEYPFRKLDFVVKWQLNDTYDLQVKKIGYSLDLKVTNILNSEREIRQGDVVVESYKPGTEFTLSFSMKY